jgi:hypothetical protein
VSSEQPQTQDELPYAPLSAANAHDWMLFSHTQPVLFRTSDGGRNWSTVAMTPPWKLGSGGAADFVTAIEG